MLKVRHKKWEKNILCIVDLVAMWVLLIYHIQDIPIRVSQDAGHFICVFRLSYTLAEVYKEGLPARVVFVHGPPRRW